ncbi:MAG: DNA-formamidopyrimidine glycosylase [Veillonellales bacterium]
MSNGEKVGLKQNKWGIEMPEMPEVETIRRTLVDKVTARKIIRVEMLLPRLIKWPDAARFQAIITDKTIKRLSRSGKYLLFYLTDGLVMVVHLRMTGRLYYIRQGEEQEKYVRIVFTMDTGDQLVYADIRTLGTIYAMPTEELWRISGLATMGPEPLSADFTVFYLRDVLRGRKGKIKSLLLNQKIIGGLGNIYADESLAIAGIHPERDGGSLTELETDKLFQAINKVITAGIEDGGTTFRDYRDGAGRSGKHQYHLRVYGRKDEPCRICGTPIVKSIVGGRGTHFCPTCQR